MCGRTASLSTLAAALAMGHAAASDSQDGIVQGFGVVSQDTIPEGRRVVPTSDPWRVAKGSARACAVANHLRIQNRELAEWWGLMMHAAVADTDRAAVQAAAAATEAMADFLDAINVGDTRAARNVIERFVNDAVDTGVVTL